jgi:hypothetical protein
MGNNLKSYLLPALLLVSTGMALNANGADVGNDPARWSKEDATPQARYQTASKEASAAYRENMSQCRIAPQTGRSACMKEAKAIYQQELQNAKQLLSREKS